MRRLRDVKPITAFMRVIGRALRSRRRPTHAIRPEPEVQVDDVAMGAAPSSGAKAWLIHPDIEAIMRELGIDAFVLPERAHAPVLRKPAPNGGYWRIEHVPRPFGRLDHSIQRRGDLRSPVESVTTKDGTMEVVLDLGDLPEIVAAAIPGRRLGDLIDVAAPAGDAVVEETHRRTMAQSRPTVLRTAPRGYVTREMRP